MSAECGKCGSDIVYPAGTWPVGECPSCTRDERIAALEGALRSIADGSWGRHAPPFYDVREFALKAVTKASNQEPDPASSPDGAAGE